MIDLISKNKKTKIITRFIGTSKDSYNIQNILSSIIEELSIEFHLEIDTIQLSIDKIYDYFKSFIIKTALENKEIMFYFVLDSLDQLEKENDARKLGWLPVEDLPSNVRFILSTLSEDEYEAYPILFSTFATPSQRSGFVCVLDFTIDELNILVDSTMEFIRNYDLKIKIKTFLSMHFKENKKNSLYSKLILDQSFRWNAFTNLNCLILPNTTELAITSFFEYLETKLKAEFIRTALRYLTLSRKGIYFENWNKLLSNKFENSHFALLQLISELRQYLLGPLFRWYHRKFIEVAKQRYCSDIDECLEAHHMITKMFWKSQFDKNDLFWINELPYHAIYSKDVEIVKENFLLNIEFMKIKIDVAGVDELINDYVIAKNNFSDSCFSVLHTCLVASSPNLRIDSKNLTNELLGNFLVITKS